MQSRFLARGRAECRAPGLRRLLHYVCNLTHELSDRNRLVVLPVVHLGDLSRLFKREAQSTASALRAER